MSDSTPIWRPGSEAIDAANVTPFIRELGIAGVTDSPSLYAWSIAQPEQFWPAVWRFTGIIGEPGGEVLRGGDRMAPPDPENGPRWFPGLRCVARHSTRLRVFWVARQDVALQHLYSIASVQVGLVARAASIYAIQIESRCSEVLERVWVILSLQAADGVEGQIVIDELTEVGISSANSGILFVIYLCLGCRRSLEFCGHFRGEVVQDCCIKLCGPQGPKHPAKTAFHLIRARVGLQSAKLSVTSLPMSM